MLRRKREEEKAKGLTASTLRKDVYRLLDQVAETGRPLVIERKGRRLKIVREESGGRLKRLTPHPCMNQDPESLVHIDWSEEWHPDLP